MLAKAAVNSKAKFLPAITCIRYLIYDYGCYCHYNTILLAR